MASQTPLCSRAVARAAQTQGLEDHSDFSTPRTGIGAECGDGHSDGRRIPEDTLQAEPTADLVSHRKVLPLRPLHHHCPTAHIARAQGEAGRANHEPRDVAIALEPTNFSLAVMCNTLRLSARLCHELCPVRVVATDGTMVLGVDTPTDYDANTTTSTQAHTTIKLQA